MGVYNKPSLTYAEQVDFWSQEDFLSPIRNVQNVISLTLTIIVYVLICVHINKSPMR